MALISHIPSDNLPESSSSFSNLDKIFHFFEFLILGSLIQLSFLESKATKIKGTSELELLGR